MTAMLGNSVVVVVVVRTRPRAIPLAMITMRKSTHGFPLLSRDKYWAPLGGPLGCRSSAKKEGVETYNIFVIWSSFQCTFQELNLLDMGQITIFLLALMPCFNLRSKSLPQYFNDFCIENTWLIHNYQSTQNGWFSVSTSIQPFIKYGWYMNARRKKKIPGPSFGI